MPAPSPDGAGSLIGSGVSVGDQIALAGVVLAAIVFLATVYRQPLFISAGRAAGLEKTVADLRAECAQCREESKAQASRISFLESHVAILRSDLEFWQTEYRKYKEAHP